MMNTRLEVTVYEWSTIRSMWKIDTWKVYSSTGELPSTWQLTNVYEHYFNSPYEYVWSGIK